MHKYAVQITVADARDGACSSSTLKEACSWGKVDTAYEQMVFAEAGQRVAAAGQRRLSPRALEEAEQARICEIVQLISSPRIVLRGLPNNGIEILATSAG